MLSLLTNHARKQAQRRGISIEAVSLIIEEADIRDWSGDGCRNFFRMLHPLTGSGFLCGRAVLQAPQSEGIPWR